MPRPITGTASCPTCGTLVRVRRSTWRCPGGCGTHGTTLPDGHGGARLAVVAAPASLPGIQGRYRQQLLDTKISRTTQM